MLQVFSLTHSESMPCQHRLMAKHPDIEFGNRLQRLINEAGLSHLTGDELGKRFGVSGPMLTYYRQGDKLPAMRTAIRMAVSLNCCVEYLLTGRGPKHPGIPDDDGIDEPPWRDLPPGARHHFAEALRAIADAGAHYKEKQIKK
jgi:transcriptional regulator with XRE-family HTH domain